MASFTKDSSCFNCNHKLNSFCYMNDEQLSTVDRERQEVHFKAGETIFKTGGPLTHMICITSGMVKIYLEDPNSERRILMKISKPVEMILGPGFLVDNRHHFTVVALDDTTACYIEVQQQKDIMQSNAEYSVAIVKHINEIIINQLNKLMSLTLKQTHGKMAECLLYLANEIYRNDVFDTKLSRQDLADLSAMTKETVIRILKDFSEEKIIICDQHHFEILDKDKLLKISKTG